LKLDVEFPVVRVVYENNALYEANALLKDIHDRMPSILRQEDYDLWLDSGVTDPVKVADLLKPFDIRLMRIYPVSSTVNRVDNDGPECAQEIDVPKADEQPSLFTN